MPAPYNVPRRVVCRNDGISVGSDRIDHVIVVIGDVGMRYEEGEGTLVGVIARIVDQLAVALPQHLDVVGSECLRTFALVRHVDGVTGILLRDDITV